MTVGIYGIFDSKTDECLYVGKSINIEQRYANHLAHLKSEKHIRKDFVQWFIQKDKDRTKLYCKVLEECVADDKALNVLEIKWFKQLSPKFYGEEPSDMKRWGASKKVREILREKSSNPLSLTKEDLELLYNAKSVKEISKETDRSERQICNLLKKFEIVTHKEKLSKVSKEKICVMCLNIFIPLKKTVVTCSKKCAGKLSIQRNNNFQNFLSRKGTYQSDKTKQSISATMKNNKNARGNKGGKITAHNRWHVDRKIIKPDCEYCQEKDNDIKLDK